jgi:hypothetical protein
MLPANFVPALPALAAAFERITQAWARYAEQRAARRWADAQQASLAELDAHTLRDLGLGDWAATRTEGSAWLRWESDRRRH